MDDGGQRENGRYRADQYRPFHAQWMMPQPPVKDHTFKLIAAMTERDNAIQERNLALSEKKVALAERDMAMLQRDAAIAERNTAIMERDNAIAALEYARNNMNDTGGRANLEIQSSPLQLCDAPYDHTRGMHISEALPISSAAESSLGPQQSKQLKVTGDQADRSIKASKSPKKRKRDGGDKNLSIATDPEENRGGGGGRKRRPSSRKDHEWKDQDLGLNLVTFDDTTMLAPFCSCTGRSHQCYKWGNGGWQSACCTTKMSMFPLPMMPDKPHSRVGGRKMSGSAFAKLLTRLAAEGHDLSMPLDLKNHWAKHGTNRYITLK